MQIKTILKFHLTSSVATIKNTKDNKCWWGYGKKESSITADGSVS
jgi:hypothetical protein